MIGKYVLHYKILEKLGEGGMGIVYLAEDTKLERKVAVKFLPHQVSVNEEEKERFKIEAKAAASLNHPNIAQIYSIEESGEEIFIVMEYIEGKELKNIIETHNDASIQMNDIVDYAILIAEGLEAAHKKGIIHRDIKSSNIMVTDDGKVKIMDFGLAKVKGGSQVTKIGTTIGTTAYMSPEQARGEKVDDRTDIWSFGVVLYEMLTGKLPFAGDYDQAIIYSILNEKQKPFSSSWKKFPDGMEQIVNNSLEKNPHKRFNDFSEVLTLLQNIKNSKGKDVISNSKKIKRRTIIAIASAILIIFLLTIFLKDFNYPDNNTAESKSKTIRIAVLPFNNIKKDKETNFLGFALADQIIGSLAYVNNILVRPASSVRQFESEQLSPKKAGNQLKVEYILDGSYLKNADRIRLNLELINIRLNEIVWRNNFDVKYENAFKLQDLVSRKVMSGLQIQFSPKGGNKNIPKNSLVYEYYLKSIENSHTVKDIKEKALPLLKKAVSLDSTFAPLFVALGDNYISLSDLDPTEKGYRKAAETAYKKALLLNSNLLSALNGLARLYMDIGKHIEAVKLVRRVLQINPNNAGAHFELGYIFRYTGMLDYAVKEMSTAIKLDPESSQFKDIAQTYFYVGKYRDALDALGTDQNNPFVTYWRGEIYIRKNKMELAKQNLKRTAEIDSGGIIGSLAETDFQFISGNPGKALNILNVLDSALEKSDIYDGETYYILANKFRMLGNVKDCIRLLKKSVDHGFYNYQLMVKDSLLDYAVNNLEFKRVLQIAKSESEKFKNKLIENTLLD